MKLRHLRIAWSVTWGIAVLLLISLWVRSYWGRSSSEVLVTPTHKYYVHSLGGTVAFVREERTFITVEIHRIYAESDFLRLTTNAGLRIVRNDFDGSLAEVSISYWLLTAATVFVAAIPWLPWRFSLRALLIFTTLVAVALGLIMWPR